MPFVQLRAQTRSAIGRGVGKPGQPSPTDLPSPVVFSGSPNGDASDTLALNSDGSLYAPELMREVMDAVKRENLQLTTVFAMHQEPVPWAKVTALVESALN